MGDLLSFSAPAGVSEEDARILGRMGWALFAVQLLLWVGLVVSARALLRRRNWARIVAIILVGYVGFCLVWLGAALVFLGFSDMSYFRNATELVRMLLRVIPMAIGAMSWALVYLCGRVIWRLCSTDVRREFLAPDVGAKA